jgi:PTH1 family peptidyl-tRNA hydrolase
MVLAELADRMSANFKSHRTNSAVAEGRSYPGGPKLILAKPNTYMNVSGGPVAALLRFYSLDPSRLIVLHDDLDIPFDTVKLKLGGGHGGHNGLRDIIAATGTNDFIRVRIGIGRPPGRQDVSDFVLSNYSSAERKDLPIQVVDAADAVESLVLEGLERTQQRFNS